MPDLKMWSLSVASVNKKSKELNYVRVKFQSDAQTVAEAFEALYDAGFCCVQKANNKITASGNLLVRVSAGDL